MLPAWEEYSPKDDEVLVTMDPGMAFGTGTHETTRLVIGMLQDYMFKGAKMLDVGTGSGILAIAASLMGAELVCSYDIDPVAVKVAKDNYETNGCYNVECGVSDLLASAKKQQGGYDLVLANIVADVIIPLAPQVPGLLAEGATFLCSGIIDTRAHEVEAALKKVGLSITKKREKNGWVALEAKMA